MKYLHRRLACHADWAILAPEILLCIFHSTPSRKYSLDPRLGLGPRSPWMETMRTRKALALVCKSWHGAAIEVLYEDIVIRRMGQIVALARTLRSDKVGFARLIKAIRIDTLAIPPSCIEVVKEDLETIMSRCTMLKELSVRHDETYPSSPYPKRPDVNMHAYIPTWIVNSQRPPIYQQLQRLCFAAVLTDDQLPVFHRLIASAVHLVSLVLCTDPKLPTECFSSLEPLSLASLEELTVDNLADYLTKKWTLPKLHSLTVLHANALPIDLLHAHGRLLRYLHLYCSPSRSGFPLYRLEQLSQLCPTLHHLVLPLSLRATDAPLFTLPHLCCLDVWASCCGCITRPFMYEGECNRIHSVMERSGVAATCTIRVIGLLDEIRMVDLPRVFPPGSVKPGEWRVHEVPGARVIQTSWALVTDPWPYAVVKCECSAIPALHAKGVDIGSYESGSDTDEDGNYEEDSEEDLIWDGSETGSGTYTYHEPEDTTSLVSDGGSDTSGDDDGSGTDEDDDSDLDLSRDYPRAGQQLDRDTILELFSRSQHALFEIDGLYDDDDIAQENLLTASTDRDP